jgi:hypothetical protein
LAPLGFGWLWLAWLGFSWLQLSAVGMVGFGWLWLAPVGSGWQRLVSVDFGWLRWASVGFGWLQLAPVGFGLFWFASVGFAWLRLASVDWPRVRHSSGNSSTYRNFTSRRGASSSTCVSSFGFRFIVYLLITLVRHLVDLFEKDPSPPLERKIGLYRADCPG